MPIVRFRDLRRIALDPPSESDSDLVKSIRRNAESSFPDGARVAVSAEMAAMIPDKTRPAVSPPEPAPEPEPE